LSHPFIGVEVIVGIDVFVELGRGESVRVDVRVETSGEDGISVIVSVGCSANGKLQEITPINTIIVDKSNRGRGIEEEIRLINYSANQQLFFIRFPSMMHPAPQ
jgi:hypothetical protein